MQGDIQGLPDDVIIIITASDEIIVMNIDTYVDIWDVYIKESPSMCNHAYII